MPNDLRKVASRHDAIFDLDYVSYQQYAPPNGTLVDGGQVTVVSRNGRQLLVGGAYYPGLRAQNRAAISMIGALNAAASVRGGLHDLPPAVRGHARRSTSMRLDPVSGRLFYLVTTAAPANNTYQQIDAQTGELLATWGGVDQISAGQGKGVKGDTKNLTTHSFNSVPVLTAKVGGVWRLQSPDQAFITYDAKGGHSIGPNSVMTDAASPDNKWQGSNQKAGVDAQYYAALTVQFFNEELGYDWLHDCHYEPLPNQDPWPAKVRSVVHFDDVPGGNPYDNAFWDEQEYFMVYGDGSSFDRPLSAAQDVVSHELSHAVTQCTGNLKYRSESGALNESFSDIMATAAEFALEEPLSSNCRLQPGQARCADWLIGEDLARTASGFAIRDLSDPEAEHQPSHYDDRTFKNKNPDDCNSSGNDYCDVHHNSGISNHAFYLMVSGGRNARCSGPTDPQADCDVVVPPTSLDHATRIWFAGVSVLTNDATMCDARNSTIGAASVLYPDSATDIGATILAWQAVGLDDAQCDGDANADFDISLSTPTIVLPPGQAGSTHLSIVRNDDNGEIDYTAQTPGPASVLPNPPSNSDSSGSDIEVTVNNDAADGIYPILVTATGHPNAYYAAASLVVDATAPAAAVSKVGFVALSTIKTNGSIALRVTWNATDSASGVTSAQLEHSTNGSVWAPVQGTSPTAYEAGTGPHQFHVVATDAVGNSATSVPLTRSLIGYQEAALTYTRKWLTDNSAGTPWGNTRYSKRRKATAQLTFTGTDVVWVAQRGPKRGAANVYVDGVKTHVDLSSGSLTERRVVFIASGLPAGQHTIKIKVKGTSGRPRVDVDGILVLAAP